MSQINWSFGGDKGGVRIKLSASEISRTNGRKNRVGDDGYDGGIG